MNIVGGNVNKFAYWKQLTIFSSRVFLFKLHRSLICSNRSPFTKNIQFKKENKWLLQLYSGHFRNVYNIIKICPQALHVCCWPNAPPYCALSLYPRGNSPWLTECHTYYYMYMQSKDGKQILMRKVQQIWHIWWIF